MVSAIFSSTVVSGPTKEELVNQLKEDVENITVSALVLQSRPEHASQHGK